MSDYGENDKASRKGLEVSASGSGQVKLCEPLQWEVVGSQRVDAVAAEATKPKTMLDGKGGALGDAFEGAEDGYEDVLSAIHSETGIEIVANTKGDVSRKLVEEKLDVKAESSKAKTENLQTDLLDNGESKDEGIMTAASIAEEKKEPLLNSDQDGQLNSLPDGSAINKEGYGLVTVNDTNITGETKRQGDSKEAVTVCSPDILDHYKDKQSDQEVAQGEDSERNRLLQDDTKQGENPFTFTKPLPYRVSNQDTTTSEEGSTSEDTTTSEEGSTSEDTTETQVTIKTEQVANTTDSSKNQNTTRTGDSSRRRNVFKKPQDATRTQDSTKRSQAGSQLPDQTRRQNLSTESLQLVSRIPKSAGHLGRSVSMVDPRGSSPASPRGDRRPTKSWPQQKIPPLIHAQRRPGGVLRRSVSVLPPSKKCAEVAEGMTLVLAVPVTHTAQSVARSSGGASQPFIISPYQEEHVLAATCPISGITRHIKIIL